MKLGSRTVAVGVGVLVLALVGLFWFAPTDPDREGANPLLGKPAPSIVATTSEGEPIRLTDYRGSWVVVNFFATWCTPCQVEQPELVRWAAAHDGEGDGRIISVAYDDSPRAIAEFFARSGGDWPVVADGADRFILDFGVVKLPESYLISPGGTVVHKFVGGLTAAGIDDAIATASKAGGT